MFVTAIARIILTVLNTVFAMVALVMIILGCFTLYAGDFVIGYVEPMLEELRANGLPQASLTQNGFDIYSIAQNVAVPMIVCGLILFAVAFCGCCGANWENRLFLLVYAVAMGVIIAAEILAIIVIAGGQEQWKSQIIDQANVLLENNYQGSNGTDGISVIANVIFMKFNCCTWSDVTLADQQTRFSRATNFNKSMDKYYIPEKQKYAKGPIKIPFTCCIRDQPFPAVSPADLNCASAPDVSNAYVNTACFNKAIQMFLDYQVHAVMGAFCVILLELVIMLFALLIYQKAGHSDIV